MSRVTSTSAFFKLSLYLLFVLALPAISAATPDQYPSENLDECDDGGADSFAIHPASDSNKCLDVRGGVFANGTPVTIYDCNGTPAQQWTSDPGTAQIRVAGQQFCLDAGTTPKNGIKMKIWTCYSDLPAQTWYYTEDKNIELKDGGQCLDMTEGSSKNGNVIQTWSCSNGNKNQIWTV